MPDTPQPTETIPTDTLSWGYKIAKDLGVGTIFAIVLGYASSIVYNDLKKSNEERYIEQKAHQAELMAYLTNRNDSDAKRAIADSELSHSLNRLSDAIDRSILDKRTAASQKEEKTIAKP